MGATNNSSPRGVVRGEPAAGIVPAAFSLL